MKNLPLYGNVLLGLWLMAAPAWLGYGDPAQVNDRVVGPLAAAAAIIALSEVTRGLRWVNLLLGVWLLIAPWLLGYAQMPLLNSLVVGALMILFALSPGERNERVGGGWRALWSRGGEG